MISSVDSEPVLRSSVWPCAICKRSMGDNYILCIMSSDQMHTRRSGVLGSLHNVTDFICRVCSGNQTVESRMEGS